MCEKTPHSSLPSSVEHPSVDGPSRIFRNAAVAGIVALSGVLSPGCIANPTPHPEKPEASSVDAPGQAPQLTAGKFSRNFDGDDANEAEQPVDAPATDGSDPDQGATPALPPAPKPTILGVPRAPDGTPTKSKSDIGDLDDLGLFARTI